VHAAAPDQEGLRKLAGIRLEAPVLLSLYLNLDPSELPTPPDRATAVRSILDEAEREVRAHERLTHEQRMDLEASLELARERLRGDIASDGAQSVALFLCRSAGVDELLKLPRPVPSRVAIDHSPLVGPLAGLERRERWCVTLVSRRDARVFRGSADGLREVVKIHDDTPGQHDQGGWSQSRYQRSIEKDVGDHLKRVGDRLLRHFGRQPFERLVLGGPREVTSAFGSGLHSYLSDLLAGHIEVDVDGANADTVLDASRELFEQEEERHEQEALDRLRSGARAECGLANVLEPLNERRVQELLIDPGFSEPGAVCPACGMLRPAGEGRCPADGSPLRACDDVGEQAIELALLQSADVLPLRRHAEELGERGGIAVLLRF
jgi:peptide subunit release factor 1 (eRF1)